LSASETLETSILLLEDEGFVCKLMSTSESLETRFLLLEVDEMGTVELLSISVPMLWLSNCETVAASSGLEDEAE
jgi:hypothetical protein